MGGQRVTELGDRAEQREQREQRPASASRLGLARLSLAKRRRPTRPDLPARVSQCPVQPVLAIACWGRASYSAFQGHSLWLGQIPPAHHSSSPPLPRTHPALSCWPSVSLCPGNHGFRCRCTLASSIAAPHPDIEGRIDPHGPVRWCGL
jgi:hypothetical protein